MPTKLPRPFGYHLMLDCYHCDPTKMNDINHCYAYLEALVKGMKMDRQSPPIVFGSPQGYPDKAGLSAWSPIVQSGISIHSLEVKNYMSIDAYSCVEYDKDLVISLTKEWYSPKKITTHFVLRGIDYYENE